jgi:hypothetical protein
MKPRMSKKTQKKAVNAGQITRDEVARAITSLINAAQLEGNDKLAEKIFGEDHDCAIYEDLSTINQVTNCSITWLPPARRALREKIAEAINDVKYGKAGAA